MAKQTPNTIKGWFITFAKPVQQQFWDWLDSFRHKDEKIGYDDMTDEVKLILETVATVNVLRPEEKNFLVDGSFPMLAKYRLNSIAAINSSASDMTLKLGTTAGGEEIATIDLPANGTASIDLGLWFFVETTVYVSDVLGSCILLIDRK